MDSEFNLGHISYNVPENVKDYKPFTTSTYLDSSTRDKYRNHFWNIGWECNNKSPGHYDLVCYQKLNEVHEYMYWRMNTDSSNSKGDYDIPIYGVFKIKIGTKIIGGNGSYEYPFVLEKGD